MIQLATIPKVTKSAQIRNYVASNPKAKSAEVAEAVGVTPAYVATVMWNAKKKAKVVKKAKKPMTLKEIKAATMRVQDKFFPEPNWNGIGVFSSDKSLGQLAYEAGVARAKIRMQSAEGDRQIEMFEPKADPVSNPTHYTVGGIETIDFIEAKQLGYNLGNVVKYLTRADHKGNKLEDLRKAQWYLTREINSLK
jgi:prolyl-tRNA editing enzyme YbaK/EbsC (Cys-tRNA(Pro) deacylase)